MLIAQHGLRLITGAGRQGLMKAVQDAALTAGGEAVGVIPSFMVKEGWHHMGLTQLIETASMHERKQMMADLSDGAIALPGGCGTFEELLEIITWKQLGLYLNPVIILNIDGYYDHLIAQLSGTVGNFRDPGTLLQQPLQLAIDLFAGNGMVGFVAKERVDGKLVLPEAVKLLVMKKST